MLRYWLQRWRAAAPRALAMPPPIVRGGALTASPVQIHRLQLLVPVARTCGYPMLKGRASVRHWQSRTRSRVRQLPPYRARPQALILPSASVGCRQVYLRQGSWVQVRRHATSLPSPRVLLKMCRVCPAIRVWRGLPRARVLALILRWKCVVREVELFGARPPARRFVRAWQLPVLRRAKPFAWLPTPFRARCLEALQQRAQGYVQAHSVYYPVPVHAASSLEIDERQQLLYIHLREPSGREGRCIAVVLGKRVTDGQVVRAVVQMG